MKLTWSSEGEVGLTNWPISFAVTSVWNELRFRPRSFVIVVQSVCKRDFIFSYLLFFSIPKLTGLFIHSNFVHLPLFSSFFVFENERKNWISSLHCFLQSKIESLFWFALRGRVGQRIENQTVQVLEINRSSRTYKRLGGSTTVLSSPFGYICFSAMNY